MTAPHGTVARYYSKSDACRCDDCCHAKSQYASTRTRRIAYGRWEPFVDVGPAQRHVRALVGAGIGIRRIAALAGVDHAIVRAVYTGHRARPHGPITQILAKTERKLLSVTFAPEHVTPGRLVNAAGTHRRIQALVARGWPVAQLARRLDRHSPNVRAWLNQDQVSVGTALAVRELYDELWDADPVAYGVTAAAARRALNHAARRGWSPPMAWDDDTIDDPDAEAARPEPEGDAATAIVENADELLAQGHTVDQVAARLGITKRHLGRCRAMTRDAVREAS